MYEAEPQRTVMLTYELTLYVPLTTVTSSSFLTETAPTCTVARHALTPFLARVQQRIHV